MTTPLNTISGPFKYNTMTDTRLSYSTFKLLPFDKTWLQKKKQLLETKGNFINELRKCPMSVREQKFLLNLTKLIHGSISDSEKYTSYALLVSALAAKSDPRMQY